MFYVDNGLQRGTVWSGNADAHMNVLFMSLCLVSMLFPAGNDVIRVTPGGSL